VNVTVGVFIARPKIVDPEHDDATNLCSGFVDHVRRCWPKLHFVGKGRRTPETLYPNIRRLFSVAFHGRDFPDVAKRLARDGFRPSNNCIHYLA
jgi:hypothetical protein